MMTIFETLLFWIVAFIIGWTVASCVLGWIASWFIRRAHRRYPSNIYPLPSGSLRDRKDARVPL